MNLSKTQIRRLQAHPRCRLYPNDNIEITFDPQLLLPKVKNFLNIQSLYSQLTCFHKRVTTLAHKALTHERRVNKDRQKARWCCTFGDAT